MVSTKGKRRRDEELDEEEPEEEQVKQQENLFDESGGYDSSQTLKLAPGLSDAEQRQARILYRLFNELWGFILITGNPGTGKDVFGNYLQYTMKRYFPFKRILRDEKPRKMFGIYDGLFNEQFIQDDLKRMRDVARGAGGEKYDGTYMKALEKAADDWVAEKGKVLLHNSILTATEFWRYCGRRDPHKPINKTMGGIFKEKRHIDLLVIATTQLWSELDRFTCLPWVDWWVLCSRSHADSTRYNFFVHKAEYDRSRDLLITASKPFAIPVDAGKPRSFLNEGRITLTERAKWYRPETEEERIVLDVIKAGLDKYDDIVAFLETEGDMTENETLDTIKRLGLKLPGERPKMVLDYGCWYHIFNSKSAPSIRTNVRVSD